MPTLELDYEAGKAISDRCFTRVADAWRLRNGLEVYRRVVDDSVIYFCFEPDSARYRYNILFSGGRIVVYEQVRSIPMRPHFTVRGTNEALVEARLRGLI